MSVQANRPDSRLRLVSDQLAPATPPESASAPDPMALLQAAKNGDQAAFARLTERHRNALITHCYQILGTVQDAEDVVQEALLRAWVRLETYDGRAAFHTWLYRIATNAALDLLRQRRREHTTSLDSPDADLTDEGLKLSLASTVEPLSDHLLPATELDPEAAYLVRESISIAFMSLLQQLPPRQRVILLLRDVLNWQAKEVAEFMGLTELAVNSALLRARASLQTPLKSRPVRFSNDDLRALLARYVTAFETHDIEQLMALLKEDAVLTMPPFPAWYDGVSSIRALLGVVAFSPQSKWKTLLTAANGQPAFALYQSYDGSPFLLAGLQLLSLDGDQIARLDHFLIGQTPLQPEPIEPSWLPYFNLARIYPD